MLGMTFAPTEPDVHNSTPASGTLELGQFRVRTAAGIHRLAMDIGQWKGVGGIRSSPSRNGVKLRYFVTNDVVSRFRPRQPTDQSPVPVIATARIAELADPNGLLPLQVEGEPFVGRVVATARRFPTVSGDFVLADREALSTALNADAPGAAVIDEIWLKSSSASDETRMKAVLSRSAFAGLETSFRRDLRAELDREPVARASILALLVSAVVGFVLALAGLALALSTDIRDERAELFDLEAQGRLRHCFVDTCGCARSVFSASASSSVWAWARFSARLSWTLYVSPPEDSSPSRLCCSHLTGRFSEGSGCSCSSRSLLRWSSPGRRFGAPWLARGREVAAISLTDVFRVYSTPEGDAAALQDSRSRLPSTRSWS